MNKENAITAKQLREIISHIQAFVFTQEEVFDDVGQLKDVLQQTEVIFEDEDDHHAIEELHAEMKRLKALVHRDELTGLLNRRGVIDEFGALFKEALFEKDHTEFRKGVIIKDFSVIFLDIDNFKKINDTYGHDEGDHVLKGVAHVLKSHIRDIDAVGRLGGEEFVIALLGAREGKAYEKGEEIRSLISENVHVNNDKNLPLTASIGVASLHQSQAITLEDLIACADKAMYEAKTQRGKNNVVKYSEL